MTARGTAMRDEAGRGEGERREAAMRRGRAWIIGGLFVAGLVSGFYVGKTEALSAKAGQSLWTPELAIVLTAVFLVAMLAGSLLLNRVMDELERQRAYKASAAAGAALLLVYPPWFFLWKGGLLPEPMHLALFGIFWIVLAGASLWYKVR